MKKQANARTFSCAVCTMYHMSVCKGLSDYQTATTTAPLPDKILRTLPKPVDVGAHDGEGQTAEDSSNAPAAMATTVKIRAMIIAATTPNKNQK